MPTKPSHEESPGLPAEPPGQVEYRLRRELWPLWLAAGMAVLGVLLQLPYLLAGAAYLLACGLVLFFAPAPVAARRIRLDDAGVEVERHNGQSVRIAWEDVAFFRYHPGSPPCWRIEGVDGVGLWVARVGLSRGHWREVSLRIAWYLTTRFCHGEAMAARIDRDRRAHIRVAFQGACGVLAGAAGACFALWATGWSDDVLAYILAGVLGAFGGVLAALVLSRIARPAEPPSEKGR